MAEPTEQEGKYKCPETNAVISMTVPSVSVVFVVCFCLFLVVFPLPVPIHWIHLYRYCTPALVLHGLVRAVWICWSSVVCVGYFRKELKSCV